MLYFLSQRIERLRDAVNPSAGIILVHHTRKLGKKQFEEDPFQALAGAGSLRGYYSTGMLLFRPDETRTPRELIFELRNGAAIPQKHIDKIEGEWREINPSVRLAMQDYGAKLDAERRRKHDVILQMSISMRKTPSANSSKRSANSTRRPARRWRTCSSAGASVPRSAANTSVPAAGSCSNCCAGDSSVGVPHPARRRSWVCRSNPRTTAPVCLTAMTENRDLQLIDFEQI